VLSLLQNDQIFRFHVCHTIANCCKVIDESKRVNSDFFTECITIVNAPVSGVGGLYLVILNISSDPDYGHKRLLFLLKS
jgi:hypothetical protein